MAQRRMFSQKIIGSDAFIEMPVSARELYFQLGMYADDDGFINPKKIIRMVGASDDDLRILAGKRFVLPFENGVVVIKHWKINNMIRKDFYEETIYTEQKKQLITKENKAYTECQQNVNNLLPQYRIDKDRIDKDRIDNFNNIADKSAGDINHLISEFKNPTINYGNKTQRKALEDMIKKFGYDNVLGIIQYAVSVNGKQFAPVITTPCQLKDKLAQLKIYRDRQTSGGAVIL